MPYKNFETLELTLYSYVLLNKDNVRLEKDDPNKPKNGYLGEK